MILISAALVLAAIVLLIAGVVLGTPTLVMWSIVVSVLSAVCLLIGALLRRHELFPSGGRAAEGTAPTPQGSTASQLAPVGAMSGAYGGTLAGAPAHPVATPMVAAPPVTHHGAVPPQPFPGQPFPSQAFPAQPFPPQPSQRTAPVSRPPATTGRGLAPDAIVLVIPGRRRFHLATCRQLAGRETEELTYEEAREEGFTPCTTCLPEISARTAGPEEPTPRDSVPGDDKTQANAAPGDTASGDAALADAATGETALGGAATGEKSADSAVGDTTLRAEAPRGGTAGDSVAPNKTAADKTTGDDTIRAGTLRGSAAGGTAGVAGRESVARDKAADKTAADKTAGDDTIRAEAPRGEAGPTTTPRPAGGSAATDPESPRSAPADHKPAVAGLPETGVQGSRPSGPARPSGTSAFKAATSGAATSGTASSGTASSGTASPGAGTSGSASSGIGSSAGPDKTDEKREKSSGGTDDEGDGHTPVDWFGRSTSKPSGTGSPASGTRSTGASGSTGSSASSTSSGASGSSASSVSSWSVRSWSPSGTGDEAGRADDETDESITDTAEHDWFRPGKVRPWDPAPVDAAGGEDPGESDSSRSATPGETKAPGKKPVESAETTESGRAGFEASAGSTTSKPAPATSGGDAGATSAADDDGDSGGGAGESGGAGKSGAVAERVGSADSAADTDSADDADEAGDAEDPDEPGPSADADGDAWVRVMIGTRRYHNAECPLVSGIDDSGVETMTRAEADASGLTPCSVCRNG